MRWPLSARITTVLALVVIALAVGGAGLGLALANRGEAAGTEAAIAGSIDRDIGKHADPRGDHLDKASAQRGIHDHRGRISIGAMFPGHGRAIVHAGRILGSRLFGTTEVRGAVIEVTDAFVLIETANGERRRVHGIGALADELESKRETGDEVTVTARTGLDGRLTAAAPAVAGPIRRVDAASSVSIVIAIGEATEVSAGSIRIATIRGNDVEVLATPEQLDGVEPGDQVVVVASRLDDTLTARSVMRIGGTFARDLLPRIRAFAPTRALTAF